jgi:ABC-type sugar transport system ATPase subunit
VIAVAAPPRQETVATLEMRDGSKAFGHVVALDRVSLACQRAEVLAIVGDNGAGKSTMVKVLAGVHQLDSGQLLIDGAPVKVSSPAQARALGISTVFQDLALVECLDIAANMYLGSPLTKHRWFVDRAAMIEGAADMLRDLRVRISSVRVPVGVLSGGQRQGVALARAVHQRGDIILMDEPTAALGVRETAQVLDMIDELRARGKAVILVSHDLEFVFSVADRIQVMRLGRVQGVRDRAQTNRAEIVGLITGINADERVGDGAHA